MTDVSPSSAPPSRPDCPPAEWRARTELAAAYRVFDLLGWSELIYNHISLRVPGAPGHFLVNPFGLHYSEVTASNLVKVDLEGRIVGPSAWPVNPAGLVPHAAIHRALPDAHCVMHTHTTAGVAVASSDAGLSMDNFYAAQLAGRVAYHDFEGITIRADEGPRLLASIGDRPAVILRNHGLLAWGPTVAAGFAMLWTLQRACEIQVAGAALGPTRPIAPAVLERCARDALQFDPRHGGGQDVFDALVRRVARLDPSWRT